MINNKPLKDPKLFYGSDTYLQVQVEQILNAQTFSSGCQKKIFIMSGFEFLTLGGVFLGVKNKYKNSETKKILGCLAKF